MRSPIRKSIQSIVALACLALFLAPTVQAQILFETQFTSDAQERIGETEKNMSGKALAELLMRSTRVQVKGAEEAVDGHLLIVFFGEEGTMLHTVASDLVKLNVESSSTGLADVMPGDRVVEGFERSFGDVGLQLRKTGTLEPPPIMGISKKEGEQEPPPIMGMEPGEVNPEIQKILWSDVREPGVGVVFVPVLGRYSEGGVEEVRVHPAIMTGALGK